MILAFIRFWVAAALLLPLAVHAENITWMLFDLPPAMIAGPAMHGQGYADQQLKFLISRMPEFHHDVDYVSPSRVWYQMEHMDGICTLSVEKNPQRQKFGVFNDRPFRGASTELVIRADRYADFHPFVDESGAIDLNLLGQAANLKTAYSDGTSYGRVINEFLGDKNRRNGRVSLENVRFPINLLSKGRVDFIFGAHLEVEYFKIVESNSEKFMSIPIKGEAPARDAYIVCSDRPGGRKAIGKINEILRRDDNMTDYLQPLRQWYDPADFAKAIAAIGRR